MLSPDGISLLCASVQGHSVALRLIAWLAPLLPLWCWEFDGLQSPQEEKKTVELRHQALSSDLLLGRSDVEEPIVEESDQGDPGPAGLWGSQGGLNICSPTSACYYKQLGLDLILGTEPWPAEGEFKNLGLISPWVARACSTGRKDFMVSTHVWMPMDFPSRIGWQMMPTKCQSHFLKTTVLLPFPKSTYEMSSSSPSSKLSKALPLWQLRQDLASLADTTASAWVLVWCPSTAPQDLPGSEKRVLLMQPEFIFASRSSDFWLCFSQPVQ